MGDRKLSIPLNIFKELTIIFGSILEIVRKRFINSVFIDLPISHPRLEAFTTSKL